MNANLENNQNDNLRTRASRVTTRQEIIAKNIDEARRNVIEAELDLQFYKELQGDEDKSLHSSLDTNGLFSDIDGRVAQYQECYNFWLKRLDFFKRIREDNIRKTMVKEAKKIMDQVPSKVIYPPNGEYITLGKDI
jgi:hypothetical protein